MEGPVSSAKEHSLLPLTPGAPPRRGPCWVLFEKAVPTEGPQCACARLAEAAEVAQGLQRGAQSPASIPLASFALLSDMASQSLRTGAAG